MILDTTGAVALTLTLHGVPIPGEVDVYRLAVPVVELERQPEPEPAPARFSPAERGALIGFAAGCAVGTGLGVWFVIQADDERPVAQMARGCLAVGAMGALMGLVTEGLDVVPRAARDEPVHQ